MISTNDLTTELLPQWFEHLSPGEEFKRMEIPSNEGIHTGGVWESADGLEVWKPLDGRSNWVSIKGRIPTREGMVLESMAGKPGFPKNWRVEVRQERKWLVRPKVLVIPDTYPEVSLEEVLKVEAAVRCLNATGWQISDRLRVAVDADGEPFILDLSAVSRIDNAQTAEWMRADNTQDFYVWAEDLGFKDLIRLRHAGHHLISDLAWRVNHPREFRWVYRAREPISRQLARALEGIRRETLLNPVGKYWLVTAHRIPLSVQQENNLETAWKPIEYKV
jgi:hypothetical protein